MEVGLQYKNVSLKELLQRRVKYKVGKFCEIIRPKIVTYQSNFVLPQYSTHMKLPKKLVLSLSPVTMPTSLTTPMAKDGVNAWACWD